MAPSSPNESGEITEDAYWVLKYDSRFETSLLTVDGRNYEDVQPVACSPCDFETWQVAPKKKGRLGVLGRIALLQWDREMLLGRRINDEIAMFEEGMKDEYEEMRRDMEARGLTVRAHVQQAEGAKFPKVTARATSGEGEGVTLYKRCNENLEHAIGEYLWSGKFEFGVVADVPGPSKLPTLGVVRAREDMLDAQYMTFINEVTGQKMEKCKIIGVVKEGRVAWDVEEEEVKRYFDSLGKFHKVVFQDLVKHHEEEEKRVALAKKREAKKHRRQLTSSSGTAKSAASNESGAARFGGEEGEVNEEVRMRQREKFNEKRRAQKERKKAQDAEKAKEGLTIVTQTDSDDEKDDLDQAYVLLSEQEADANGNTTITLFPFKTYLRAHASDQEGESNVQGGEKLALEGAESGDGGADGDGGGAHGVEVVTYGTEKERQEAIVAHGGRGIFGMEQAKSHGLDELKYVGRGL